MSDLVPAFSSMVSFTAITLNRSSGGQGATRVGSIGRSILYGERNCYAMMVKAERWWNDELRTVENG